MSSIYSWSVVAANNATSDDLINWQEGQAPGTVNGSARQLEARVAELIGDIGGALTAGGTADALTVTANSAFTAYANGLMLALRIATDNTGAATLNVNALGAKSIRKMVAAGESALTGAELQATGIYLLMYSTALNAAAGGWLLLNPTIDAATLTGTQTLTNKTLTSPAINTPTITGGSGSGMTLTTTTLTSPTISTPTMTGGSWTGGTDLAIADGGTGASTAAAAFTALKQAATETATGVVELATTAEASAGIDTTRAVTAAGLAAGVPALTADLAVGAVGTYAMMQTTVSAQHNPGDTLAGSGLRYTSAFGTAASTIPAGTWRCMGFSPAGADDRRTTTWLRIS